MFKYIKILLYIVSIHIFFPGCEGKSKIDKNVTKIFEEINDSSSYFSDENNHIKFYKYYNGLLAVYNQFNNKIQIYDRNIALKKEFSRKGRGQGELINPTSLIYDNDGIFVLDSDNRKIVWFYSTGELKKEFFLDQTAMRMTKSNDIIIFSSIGTFDYYLYKFDIEKDFKLEGMISRITDSKTLNVQKIFADSYIISNNSLNIFLTKMYEDCLLVYSIDGQLISTITMGFENIKNPQSMKKNHNLVIMQDPLFLHMTNDKNGDVYLLGRNPKTEKFLIYKYTQEEANDRIYILPFKTSYFEVIEENKFLVKNNQNEILILSYKL